MVTFTNLAELQQIFQSFQDGAIQTLEGEDPAAMSAVMLQLWAGLLRMLEIYGIVIFTFLVSIPFYFIYRITALRFMINVSNLSEVGFTANFSGWRIVGNWVLYALVSALFVAGGFVDIEASSAFTAEEISRPLSD